MDIYCCQCGKDVKARLTNGAEIYPHRKDLADLPFWRCGTCLNFVGCHHKTKNRTKPLGVIANDEIKKARIHIHAILDPLWKNGLFTRKEVYGKLTKALGKQYHTAEIRTIEDARKVYIAIRKLKVDTL